MTETQNPYIAGSPITGPEMFFGREDVFHFVRQALSGQHRDHVLVLYGQRRTGKTSVLYQMSRELGERYVCIFIDLHGLALNGLGGFLWELANHIARVLRRDYGISLPALDRSAFQEEPRSAFEDAFLDNVWAAVGERHLLLMLDEAIRLEEQVQAGKLEIEIFSYLRHLMQHHPRLNFLFSLGSGLEEMQKEYAFLFNVALYKKISFLDRASAEALIVEPVKDGCPFQPEAVERILEVTSGHPYFTQLICHSLFNRCQGAGSVTVADVEAVLDEAVERGLAVLKHVWEESTPGEKAVLAAIAAAAPATAAPAPAEPGSKSTAQDQPVPVSPGGPRAASSAEIVRTWAERGVTFPESEAARAVRSLVARDVIAGTGAFTFTVDLMRLWVQKFRRLEWVKEEIEEAAQLWAWREQERRDQEEREREARDRQQRDRERAQAMQTGRPQAEPAGGIQAAAGEPVSRKSFSLPVATILVAVAALLGIVYYASSLLGLRVPGQGPVSNTPMLTEGPTATKTSLLSIATLGGQATQTEAGFPTGEPSPATTSQAPAPQRPALILSGDAAKVSDMAVLGGYVWAATEGGLVRWSGDGTYKLFPGTDLGLADDCIQAIAARPSDSTLWLGCGGVAVMRVDGSELAQQGYYDRDDGLGMGVVRALAVDADGRIWAGGIPDEGRAPPLTVFTAEDETWHFPEELFGSIKNLKEIPLTTLDISSLFLTPEYRILVGLHDDGILELVDRIGRYFGEDAGVGGPDLKDRRIRRLLVDRNGDSWAAASDQGLLHLKARESQWTTVDLGPGGAPIMSVAEFSDGSLWAGGDYLVVRSDDGGATWTQVGTQEGLGDDIGALVQDESGRVWAGAYGGGVSVWDGQHWKALQ